MASNDSSGALNPTSEEFSQARPLFWIGQHDSTRVEALTDSQYCQVLNAGYAFTTAPITNAHFHQRVKALYQAHVSELETLLSDKERANPSLPDPIVPTFTDEDTSLGPSPYIGNVLAYSSPWIDLGSSNPIIASISRQVLNLEVAFANWCGVRSVIVPGPRRDDDGRAIALYARAIQETFDVATRVNIIIHIPMYREPGLEETTQLLTTELTGFENVGKDASAAQSEEIDLFGAWDTWHTIRSVCNYATRLYVALKIPKRLPEKELQTRWFAEPLHYLTLGPNTFQSNKTGNPSLSRSHQEMIFTYMRLKTVPWFLLSDVGPFHADIEAAAAVTESVSVDFPSLADAAQTTALAKSVAVSPYVMYMNHLERQQEPYSRLETETLTSFQDWLQSPLQPLSDNLESSTYEMFEGDPVKYNLYEEAMFEAMSEWKTLGKPTSSLNTDELELVVTVAGAGRGPLVTRALRASERSGVPIQLWALEKNQNAYVYLLRQNATAWNGRVNVVKTDMRDWPGPRPRGHTNLYTKVDILVTELLGSFGDNELSPECVDGIQKHIARPHGLSIPESYTAWLSPIATPKIHAHLKTVLPNDANAFETPWVVRLFQMDFVAQKVPGKPRFQQAWEFVHPVTGSLQEKFADEGAQVPRTLGGGAMNNSGGLNEHNARHAHLTFYCRPRGVVHGLGGYFESTLYTPQVKGEGKELVELSILPDLIDRKSRDMVSWFPIFFPLKTPLYFPQDSELEVSIWRQTDDTRVWYEWVVEAYTWIGPKMRVKVGASELHSSKKVACLMQ